MDIAGNISACNTQNINKIDRTGPSATNITSRGIFFCLSKSDYQFRKHLEIIQNAVCINRSKEMIYLLNQ